MDLAAGLVREQQCNGEWEHEYGLEVKTIDNPGWSLTIALNGTSLAGRPYERQTIHRSEHEWVVTFVEGGQSALHAAQ
jgi:hypothetical protein